MERALSWSLLAVAVFTLTTTNLQGDDHRGPEYREVAQTVEQPASAPQVNPGVAREVALRILASQEREVMDQVLALQVLERRLNDATMLAHATKGVAIPAILLGTLMAVRGIPPNSGNLLRNGTLLVAGGSVLMYLTATQRNSLRTAVARAQQRLDHELRQVEYARNRLYNR